MVFSTHLFVNRFALMSIDRTEWAKENEIKIPGISLPVEKKTTVLYGETFDTHQNAISNGKQICPKSKTENETNENAKEISGSRDLTQFLWECFCAVDEIRVRRSNVCTTINQPNAMGNEKWLAHIRLAHHSRREWRKKRANLSSQRFGEFYDLWKWRALYCGRLTYIYSPELGSRLCVFAVCTLCRNLNVNEFKINGKKAHKEWGPTMNDC